MLENIRLAFQGIWSHKMRSFLTMLGIIIGIAAIIAIISTIKGTNEQIKDNLVGSGNNTVEIKLWNTSNDYIYEMEYNGAPVGVYPVSDETLAEIQAIDGVESVSKYNSRTYNSFIYYKSNYLSSGNIYGIDSNYLDTCGYILREGRTFRQADYDNYIKVAILDSTAAESLIQDAEPVGATIELGQEPYLVVGVVEKSVTYEPTINSMEDYYTYYQSDYGTIFIPNALWELSYGFDEPEDVVVKAVDTDSMTDVGKKAADILVATLNTNDASTVSYKAQDLLEQAKTLQELSEATNQQLLWIASISLLVGGIGVMNIMLVSVTERTREIGLKKAIGARKSKIMSQFLTEAVVLTSIGGLLGVVAGIIMSQVISNLTQTPVAISVSAIILGVAFSMGIGIVFGMLPSYKAANLNPIDALRHE